MKTRLEKLYKIVTHSVWNKKYEIKRGYIHRDDVPHYDDTPNKDEWQDRVYAYAKEVFEGNSFGSVLDLGCGSAFKLFKYFGSKEITGLEVEPTLSYLKSKYPSGKWVGFDTLPSGAQFDLVIMSDVIEHVDKPDVFLKSIIEKIDFKYIIISTPERDLARGKRHLGPPRHIYHFREWNAKEFYRFISKYLNVENQFVTPGVQKTQAVLCSKKLN